jgi:hypothetical protein
MWDGQTKDMVTGQYAGNDALNYLKEFYVDFENSAWFDRNTK